MNRNALDIPVVANGNILYHDDIDACIAATGVDGVMSAGKSSCILSRLPLMHSCIVEGHLYNPALFQSNHFHRISMLAQEYLQICQQVPTPVGYIRGHLFKLYKPWQVDPFMTQYNIS